MRVRGCFNDTRPYDGLMIFLFLTFLSFLPLISFVFFFRHYATAFFFGLLFILSSLLTIYLLSLHVEPPTILYVLVCNINEASMWMNSHAYLLASIAIDYFKCFKPEERNLIALVFLYAIKPMNVLPAHTAHTPHQPIMQIVNRTKDKQKVISALTNSMSSSLQ